jgi:hypothetical protein
MTVSLNNTLQSAHNALCRELFIFMLSVIKLNVFMMNAVVLLAPGEMSIKNETLRFKKCKKNI